jgi:hypothetical protein
MSKYSEIPDYKERQYEKKPPTVSIYECVGLCAMCVILGLIFGAIIAHADDTDETPIAQAGQFTRETHDAMPIKTAAKPSSAPFKADYPDKSLTPGATRQVDLKTLCTPGSTETARHVTAATKKAVFARYGFKEGSYKPGNYEIDHLISLELGGSNEIENLWPQHYSEPWGARQKDVVETALHRCVCNQQLSIQQAQHIIVTDWINQYQKIKADHPCDL